MVKSRRKAQYKLFTLGYERKSVASYVELLKANHVNLVIDVRETAWSNRREFAKTALATNLASNGIKYLHFKELGNPKRIRNTTDSRAEALTLYETYLSENLDLLNNLDAEIEKAQKANQVVCLTCYEDEPEMCHRSVIITALTRKWATLVVSHLRLDGINLAR